MQEELNLNSIHSKWQKEWEKGKIFEPKAGKGEKFYLTAAFPYPNSPQHIGHARTYTTTDIYARYQRLKGKNVLFPMAFHVTGTPVLGMAKRLEQKDEELLSIFEKIYGIDRKTASSLTEPASLVKYFSKDIEAGMKEIGFCIDWRRKFFTFDLQFNKFIEWQFLKLEQDGLIQSGTHPVPWCPKDGQAVGGHDTRGDVDPKIEEAVAIFFQAGEGFIPTLTYRPETLPGVTNLWANPDAKYVLCQFEEKKIYLSAIAFELLSQQISLQKIKDVGADEILSLKAKHPISGAIVPIFKANFVNEAVGTGLVMSVPAHAPFDFLALRDAGKLDLVEIKAVLKLEGFGKFPAQFIVEKMGVRSQQDPKAEEATKELYKKEAHEGRMIIAPYAGMLGAEAKEQITNELVEGEKAVKLYTLANSPIYSRSGALCTVKIVDNQWFINYGEGRWKENARKCLAKMSIMPPALRKDFEYTIEWLEQKACTRAFGLGTKFPFDKNQMIEALSDSTIYMAYYTISHIAQKMKPEELSEQFFDYVFLNKEPKEKVKMKKEWKEAREEFSYWYPLDSRHSAIDLVRNHLTFFIFNHVAIFEQKYWPKQIVANGLVTMEGGKMSKSFGNILPLRKAISQYGADVIRFIVTSSAELDADSDFNHSSAEGVASRIKFLYSLLSNAKEEGKKLDGAGKWFYSRLHEKISIVQDDYENLRLRHISQAIFYDMINDLQWYMKRSKEPSLREFFEIWSLLICPFMPHVAEEFWHELGKKKYVEDAKFASIASYPKCDKKRVDSSLDEKEEYLRSAIEDVNHILKLIKKEKPESISIIVHSSWKQKVRLLCSEQKNMQKVMEMAKKDKELSSKMGEVSALAVKYLKNIGSITGKVIGAKEEYSALSEGASFISSEFGGAKVKIFYEDDSPAEFIQKAKNSMPNKPSIVIS